MPYVVLKEGFKDSAVICNTREEAEENGKFYWPTIPFTVKEISELEAAARTERYNKRIKKLHSHLTSI